MDHAREGHGRGLTEAAGAVGESYQVNTTCGDEVRLRVGIRAGDIQSLSWEGHGCSISQASTSVLHDLVVGGSLDHAAQVEEAFRALMQARGEEPDDTVADLLGDATSFVGVGKYPARVKCALLGWMAFKHALIQAQGAEAR